MSVEDNIKKMLETVAGALRDDQVAKGIQASGRSARQLHIVTKVGKFSVSGQLVGNGTWWYQFFGRRPGKMPPIESIIQWLADKVLKLNPWAVAKSIAKSGTTIFQGRRPGVNIHEAVEKSSEQLAKDIGKAAVLEIVTKIRKAKEDNK